MSKKLRGFSIAELLISLLIISIVLSAAIPTITKKTSGTEQIWRWSSSNNSAYFGIGALQTALLGVDSIPSSENIFKGMEGIDDSTAGVRFSTSGDKLLIVKQSPSSNAKSHLMNSHISFYTLANNATSNTNDVTYTGRMALERHNIALGIGSLQSLNDTSETFLGNNTALGHYTLYRNKGGAYNTAVGEATLSNNVYGIHNTALGYQAGLTFDKGSEKQDTQKNASMNTAIGSQALKLSSSGRSNTAVGYAALISHTNGAESTGVGALSLYNSTGSGNTALGGASGQLNTTGSYNLFLGLGAGNVFDKFTAASKNFIDNFLVKQGSNNLLYIGAMPNDVLMEADPKVSPVPLLFGRMQNNNDGKRYFGVNTYKFGVNTFNGGVPVFDVTASTGIDGITIGGDTHGYVDVRGYTPKSGNSTYLHIKGDPNSMYLNSDTGASSPQDRNIFFNEGKLQFNFMQGSSAVTQANISSNANNVDLFNNRIYIGGNADNNKQLSDRLSRIDFETGGNLVLSSGKDKNMSSPASVTISGPKAFISVSAGTVYLGPNNRIEVTDGKITFNQHLTMGNYDINMNSLPFGGTSLRDNLVKLFNKAAGVTSDIRAKNIIGDNNVGLDVIKALDVKNYTYKNDKTKTKHAGVIAQQVQKLYPDAVFKGDDGYLMVKREELFFALLNAVKELYNQLQDLTAKVVGLDKRINTLEQENAALKKQNAEFEKRLERLEKKI